MTGAATDEPGEPAADRVDELVDALTLGEKQVLLRGAVDPEGIATGYVPPIERLGIPSLSMVDGPLGIRALTATAFPATVALAASWDEDLAREFGEVLAREARGADQDALLAPGVNVARVPQCGRNFEYYSEDPTLTVDLSSSAIRGIQDRGVMATVKHYVCNNQETDRHHVSAEVSERALRELYLPAFEAAVRDAGVASVMAAYNRIDGTYATEHRRLLRDVLREEWGFEGFVVSDWWATFDGEAAARAGLDLDMPGMPVFEWQEHGSRAMAVIDALPDSDWFPKTELAQVAARPWQPENPNPNVLDRSPFGHSLAEAIQEGRIEEPLLDEKVRNLLGQYERFGLLDAGESGADAPDPRPAGALDAPEHRDVARRIAERGTVLLQNDGTLPLDLASIDAIALLGPHVDEAKTGGGGSSEVAPTRTTSPAEGLRERVGDDANVRTDRGTGRVRIGSLVDGPFTDLSLPTLGGPSIRDAERTARDADVAVVVVRDDAREGEDHEFGLPGDQDELVERVAAAADRTVVVLNTAGAVAMPWRESVDAVLETWYPGQADGDALAAVLCGDADPSGRLPVTFSADPADYPANTVAQYPGIDHEAEYSEGVFVGYRHFDAAGVEPLFPFGHGLSYAAFEYGDLAVDLEADGADASGAAGEPDGAAGPTATVSVTVENVADRDGREVVQCYVSPPGEAVERPPRELAAFATVAIPAGESRTVELELDRRDVAYFDEDAGDWAVEPGEHDVLVGRSSRDRRLREPVAIGTADE